MSYFNWLFDWIINKNYLIGFINRIFDYLMNFT